QPLWLSAESTDRAIVLTLRFSHSGRMAEGCLLSNPSNRGTYQRRRVRAAIHHTKGPQKSINRRWLKGAS
ncbi:MAG: hypothetical protein ACKO3V_09200, partial [Pirellula sp.]